MLEIMLLTYNNVAISRLKGGRSYTCASMAAWQAHVSPGLTHYESTRSVVKSAVLYPIVSTDGNAHNGNEYIASLW